MATEASVLSSAIRWLSRQQRLQIQLTNAHMSRFNLSGPPRNTRFTHSTFKRCLFATQERPITATCQIHTKHFTYVSKRNPMEQQWQATLGWSVIKTATIHYKSLFNNQNQVQLSKKHHIIEKKLLCIRIEGLMARVLWQSHFDLKY